MKKSDCNYESLMRDIFEKLDTAQKDVQFLLASLGGIHYDVSSLEKRGVRGTEMESIKKILDEVSEHFKRSDTE